MSIQPDSLQTSSPLPLPESRGATLTTTNSVLGDILQQAGISSDVSHLITDYAMTPEESIALLMDKNTFTLAVSQGWAETVQKILARDVVNEESLAQALILAASQGHLPTVQALSKSPNPERADKISESTLGDAVLEAVRHGHVTSVETLLANRYLGPERLGVAVMLAAQRGNLAMVQALLGSDREISEDYRNIALLDALQYEHASIALLLLGRGKISNKTLGITLIIAASQGNVRVLEAILARRPIISKDNFDQAMSSALWKKHTEIVSILNRYITPQ